jgi:prepilin-type N-terminal cleavage/methylation domain-containing protein
MSYFRRTNEGFTLIEILVTITIIGILASIVISSVSSVREKARDARRKSDLKQIQTALFMYNLEFGDWIESGSGCGHLGNGQGWFNYGSGSYPKSIGQCLVDAGFLPQEIKDPSGNTTSSPTQRNAYMKYTCTQSGSSVTYIYAKLDGEDQDATATDGTCCTSCDSSYGMNYYVTVD